VEERNKTHLLPGPLSQHKEARRTMRADAAGVCTEAGSKRQKTGRIPKPLDLGGVSG
jgi:hypothetical protein